MKKRILLDVSHIEKGDISALLYSVADQMEKLKTADIGYLPPSKPRDPKALISKIREELEAIEGAFGPFPGHYGRNLMEISRLLNDLEDSL